VRDEPLPLKLLELRKEIAQLSGVIHQLRRSGMDDAATQLLLKRKRVEFENLLANARKDNSR
jgi:hypothetical protein